LLELHTPIPFPVFFCATIATANTEIHFEISQLCSVYFKLEIYISELPDTYTLSPFSFSDMTTVISASMICNTAIFTSFRNISPQVFGKV
jgi:hypothetical protein